MTGSPEMVVVVVGDVNHIRFLVIRMGLCFRNIFGIKPTNEIYKMISRMIRTIPVTVLILTPLPQKIQMKDLAMVLQLLQMTHYHLPKIKIPK